MIPLVLRRHGVESEVRVAVLDDAATVDDLVTAATGGRAGGPVTVDGRSLQPRTPLALAGIGAGSTVDLDLPGSAGPAPATAQLELCQVAGYGAGGRVGLAPGRHLIGAAQDRAATVHNGQIAHASAVLDIAPNGRARVSPLRREVQVDGVVCAPGDALPLGASLEVGPDAFTIVTAADDPMALRRLPDLTGVRTINRPPRLAPQPEPDPVELPTEPERPAKRRPLPWISIVIPLPIAVAVALAMHQPYFLLFGLMSPIMLLARFAEERRTARRDERRHQQECAQRMAGLRGLLSAQRSAFLQRARSAYPDLPDLLHRATQQSPRLWERRPGEHDFLRVRLGQASQPWRPDVTRPGQPLDAAEAALADYSTVDSAPLVADLAEGGGLGFSGPRQALLPYVRAALADLAIQHGPADLRLIVLTERNSLPDWDWVKWLPHAGDDGVVQLACDDGHARALLSAIAPGAVTLLVVDGMSYLEDRLSAARPLLARATAGLRCLVLTEEVSALPASCTSIVEVCPDRTVVYHEPARRLRLDRVRPAGLSLESTLDFARALAGLEDPDRPSGSSALPTSVSLAGLGELDGIPGKWALAPLDLRVPIGVSELGAFTVDLVADGPHALIAGTTGSGKSELLRTLVASLAANVSPARLNFVLIDYKGGGAFDVCGELPHTVGVVTDLDEHLGERALRCLKAEVRHREHVLRDAGASKLEEYLGAAPLPRLMVVIDEFATLASEIPDFLQSLVDIAQRGRSLGVHLVLATQRPAGVLDNKIRANTNLRIALRVQDDADSTDVIGSREAARLARGLPGRGYARLGAGELTLFQSAIVSAATPAADSRPAVQVLPFHAISTLPASKPGLPLSTVDETDLARLVGATRAAYAQLRLPPPRVPWPPALPTLLPAETLPAYAPAPSALPPRTQPHPAASPAAADAESGIALGLTDLPDQQCQRVYRWQPELDGNLACYGIVGAGTSTALATVALSAAHRLTPQQLHLYVLDADSGTLAPLQELPHVGAYIRLDEEERLRRLVRRLEAEMERRRGLLRAGGAAAVAAEPLVCLLIDNFGALRQAAEESPELNPLLGELSQIIRDGGRLRVCVALSAKQERAVPGSLSSVIPKRLVMRLADTMAYAAFGLRTRDIPEMVTGRALELATGHEVQFAAYAEGDVAAAVRAVPRPATRAGGPEPIGSLPLHVRLSEVQAQPTRAGGTWKIPVGLEDRSLGPALLTLHPGDAATIVGPARSGRSSLLCALAGSVRQVTPEMPLFALATRPSPVSAWPHWADLATDAEQIDAWVERVLQSGQMRWAFVDDADRLASRALETLGKHRDDQLTVVLAGRPDELRGFGHWAKELQRSRAGMALRPSTADGEVFKVGFPTRVPRFPVGRGYLVSEGEISIVQIGLT